jgi:hypothetical protein
MMSAGLHLRIVRVDGATVDGSALPSHCQAVAPLDELLMQPDLGGILGLGALRGAPFTLDIDRSRLRVGTFEPAVTVPLRTRARFIGVEACVGGSMRQLMIDTGCNVPLLLWGEAASACHPDGGTNTSWTFHGPGQAWSGSAELDLLDVQRAVTCVVSFAPGGPVEGWDGLIGAAAFRGMVLGIDVEKAVVARVDDSRPERQ